MSEHVADAVRIANNEVLHDRVARYYPFVHPEIYNPTEQIRLRDAVRQVSDLVESSEAGVGRKALDIGAGRGNLTTHLLACGYYVTATDVSGDCLGWITRDLGPAYGDRLETSKLNGRDLEQFDDGSFDIVSCYSVLHHVPDYLGLVREMARVTKPRGVIFIDHEASFHAWNASVPSLTLATCFRGFHRVRPVRGVRG